MKDLLAGFWWMIAGATGGGFFYGLYVGEYRLVSGLVGAAAVGAGVAALFVAAGFAAGLREPGSARVDAGERP
ncbi:hypothetical protein [Actinorhabdospora filicis]|uniref:hypothetical protein n=1 Tax=Actinorhabdospora filicis TaxID=1785913 RepID=UPI0025559F2A|nr:hypothetical protein [Actinorhabdospora filicis]